MDTLEKLGSQLSQVTMYDVKSMYNQVSLLSAACWSTPSEAKAL